MTTTTDLPVVVGPFNPVASNVGILSEGDMVTFDAFFGMEQITSISPAETISGVAVFRIQTKYALPYESNTRFIVRAKHEPVTKWEPV